MAEVIGLDQPIDLAPQRKSGLLLKNPVMIASGFGGYGIEMSKLGDLARLGALVTNPLSAHPWPGTPQPRLWETAGGFLLRTGNSNPGLGHVLRHEAKEWPGWDMPVIVRLAAADLGGYARLAARLEGVEGVAGLEIRLPVDGDQTEGLSESIDVVAAVREATLLPLLVMLPLPAPPYLPEVCLEAGADALVVAAPTTGALWDSEAKTFYSGDWYGLGAMPQVLHEVRQIATQVRAPLIARGGIQSAEEAIACLRAGAKAVQVDSVILRQPTMPWQIANDLEDWLAANPG